MCYDLIQRTDLRGQEKKLYDTFFAAVNREAVKDRRRFGEPHTSGVKRRGMSYYIEQLVKSDDPKVERAIMELEDLCSIPFYKGRDYKMYHKWDDMMFSSLEMLCVQTNEYSVGDYCLIKAINLAVGSVWFDTLKEYLTKVSKDGYH